MNPQEDDSIFDSIILIDKGITDSDDNTEESENSTKTTTKYVRTTKEQFARLLSYKTTHKDFVQGKPNASQQLEWDSFIIELNDIGPPCRTSEEWKVVWSNYKNNRKRRNMDQQSSLKIPCTSATSATSATIKSCENANSSIEKVTDKKNVCMYALDAGHLAVENYASRLALDSCLAVDQDSERAIGAFIAESLKNSNSSTEKATECEYGHLAQKNDSNRLALNDATAHLALENNSCSLVPDHGSVYLVLDPESNRDKMKRSYVEEDKENFHSKVLNKLDVLIKEQKQSNQNMAELLEVIKKKYDC